VKNIFSLVCCLLVCAVLVQYRVANSAITPGKADIKITAWDAFGYYMYLPGIFIYNDITQLKWVDSIDKQYAMTGGEGIQAQKESNGNYVCKYLGGVAMLEVPFFLIGHYIARHAHYPPDGFSPPYQYALGFGIILYCFLAILLLRSILLRYFNDATTAITILMVCLATNFIQYAAVDNALSHAYIFPLYVLVMYATIRWHERPTAGWAAACGYIIGLATICRPTEAVMLFIPLCWGLGSKEAAHQKWSMVRHNKSHIIWAVVFGFVGVLPQLIYWKMASGHFIYNVGSKWQFLNPWFRVLFGWEKGWFIYTPVTLFFIIGMFFMRTMPFKKAVLWYCLLNIYIIISWSDWRYGGSYSTRALVQGYPMFALPFAAFVYYVRQQKWRILFYATCAWLIGVNLFQTGQYCKTILHYNDMNRRYYGRIFLNPSPTPLDMSLLDNGAFLRDAWNYKMDDIVKCDTAIDIHFEGHTSATLVKDALLKSDWVFVSCTIKAPGHLWGNYLAATITQGNATKSTRVRLANPIAKDTAANRYEFYMRIPDPAIPARITLSINGFNFTGRVQGLLIGVLYK